MQIHFIKFYLWLKKKVQFVWNFIELVNGQFFKLLFYKRFNRNSQIILNRYENEKYSYRLLTKNDLIKLSVFFQEQDMEQFKYFRPHKFDSHTLNKLYKNPSFFLFGVFDQNKIIGYFFLRCFINKHCFTGRIVDKIYQGQSIAKKMGKILHNIAWSSDFRVFGTASTKNIESLKSYQAINNYQIIKNLENDFIYFEYLESEEKHL